MHYSNIYYVLDELAIFGGLNLIIVYISKKGMYVSEMYKPGQKYDSK